MNSTSRKIKQFIMPATLVNTFLFILQGSALADLLRGGRFYGTLIAVNFCLQQ